MASSNGNTKNRSCPLPSSINNATGGPTSMLSDITNTQRADITSTQRANSRALILIDLQNEFMHPDGNFTCPDKSNIPLVDNLTNLIPRFRASGGHIIWVQAFYIDRTEETAGMKMEENGSNEWLTKATHVYHISCCKPDSFGAELYQPLFKLATPEDAIVAKTGYSSFWETDALRNVLQERGIKEAFYAGLASKTCVLATIIDAVKLGGMEISTVTDCMGWRRENTHEEALERLKELEVVKLVTSKEILSGFV